MRLAALALLLLPLGTLSFSPRDTSISDRRARRSACKPKGIAPAGAADGWATGNKDYIVEGGHRGRPAGGRPAAPSAAASVKADAPAVGDGQTKTPASIPKPTPTTKPKAEEPAAETPKSKSTAPAAAATPNADTAPASGGGGTVQADWIAAHTNARAKYSVSAVKWSAGAASQAQANVDKHATSCSLEHTSGGKYGENLWAMSAGGGKGIKADDVVGSFMSEGKDFNYADPEGNHGGKVVGHFTAIVWKDVFAIGCAVAKCSDANWKDGSYVACCYESSTPGPNMGGQYGAEVPEPIQA